jgi:hypothetical protein
MKIKYLILACLCLGVAMFGATVSWADNASSLPDTQESECVECHGEMNPGIVEQFEVSRHSASGLDCSTCHGTLHTSADDAENAAMPTPETCQMCHPNQVEQFQSGKHNLAWAVMNAIPMLHSQPIGVHAGLKGCGGCHKIGEKTEEEAEDLRYGLGGCDSCHTRHTFSAAEARRPETCSHCHAGFDHPQWEMYSNSRHGIIYQIEGADWDWETSLADGASYRAPTCQYCHMTEGDHEVRTPWGFLGLRVEEPDEEWAETRATLLKALGALDAEGNPGPLFEAVGALDLARLTMDDWQAARDEMLNTCTHCHSESFARANLEESDALLQEADIVMAESVDIIKDLYEDGILPEAEGSPSAPYPFLLSFYGAPNSIEQDLYLSWMEYRQRTFQGAFHNSPDYMHWYGWAPLNETNQRIKDEADVLRSAASEAE